MEGVVDSREREVMGIMQSINDLMEIMHDLSVLVIDQGTMLDRIDYNVQKVVQQVRSGVVGSGSTATRVSRVLCCQARCACCLTLFDRLTLVRCRAEVAGGEWGAGDQKGGADATSIAQLAHHRRPSRVGSRHVCRCRHQVCVTASCLPSTSDECSIRQASTSDDCSIQRASTSNDFLIQHLHGLLGGLLN